MSRQAGGRECRWMKGEMRKGKAELRRIKEHQNDNGRGRLDDRKQWGGRRWQENRSI